MKRRLLAGLAALALVATGLGLYARHQVHALRVEKLSDDVAVVFGLGGNAAILRTDYGAVVVDTMTFRSQGEQLRALAEKLGGGPTVAVINTHYHLDHTHGNPAFEPGTEVVATAATLRHLHERDAEYWEGTAASLLPSTTFDDDFFVDVGGQRVRCLRLGRGHTDGDLVALFAGQRVLHAGDLFFNRLYPSVDLEAGGSIREWLATLDRVLELDFDTVIPGHGAVGTKDDLRHFRAFLADVWEQTSRAAAAGKSREQTLASVALTGDGDFEEIWIPFVIHLDRDYIVGRAWEEATGAVAPQAS